MISPTFILRTIEEILQFKGTLDSLLADIADGRSKPIAKEIKAISSLSGAAKGVLGGFHYDVTQSSYSRLESEIISAESLLIASVADDFIDEKDLPEEQKVKIVNNLLATIKTGQMSATQYPEIEALLIVAKDLYDRISTSPHPDSFFNEYNLLAEVVISQIRGDSSFELAEQTGGGTMAISAVVPYCYNPQLPEKYLKSAKKFGGYFQILDDVWDYKHDKRRGISTFMTTAESPEKAKDEAKKHASKLYSDCLKPLTPHEQQMYQSLNVLFHMKWVAERIADK